MITKTKQIAFGVNLNYIKTTKFKTNYMSINFIAPLAKESVSLNSLLPLVLMRGSSKYPSQLELNKRLQYLYSVSIAARNNTYGENQIFGFKINMLNDKFAADVNITEETVSLLCDIVFNPYFVDGLFDKNYVEGEKISLIDTIQAKINNKNTYSIEQMLKEMCKNEVFGTPKLGTVEDVKKITPESLLECYKNAIKEYPIEIYFVGDVDFEKLSSTLQKAFSKIERTPKIATKAEIICHVDEVKEIVEEENVKQGKLVLGFRTCYEPGRDDYHLMQLFNEVFGGSPTSKLFLNVREKMSLCYFCRSIISRKTGIMIVSSGIDADKKEIAKEAILNQLNSIKNGDITDEEFDSAKKSLINGYLQIYDNAADMETWALFRGLCGKLNTPLEEKEKVEKATREEIMSLVDSFKLDTVYFLKGKEQK